MLTRMTKNKDPLAEVEKLAGDLATIEARRDRAMFEAKEAGNIAREIADAASISQATFYRVMAAQRETISDPARYRHYAPALALEQPEAGLTVAIGVNQDQPPLATFTFDENHPVLLLVQDSYTDQTLDLWPTMAASIAASDARVGVYGRHPAGIKTWDLPSYLGVSGELWDHHLGWYGLHTELEDRVERVAAGEDVTPLVVLMTPGGKYSLDAINTAVTYGHHARLYLIVETERWHSRWSVISSTLAVAGTRAKNPWKDLITATGIGPQMPTRFGTAMLTQPEGTTEILLPTRTPGQETTPPPKTSTPARSLRVRQAAARAAVSASTKSGRPVDSRVKERADTNEPPTT